MRHNGNHANQVAVHRLVTGGHSLQCEGATPYRMALDEAYAMSGVQDTLVAVSLQRNHGDHRCTVGHCKVRAAKQFSAMRGRLLGMVTEKTGNEGSVSRAVSSTLITIRRQPFPMRIFAVRRDAATWLSNQGCTTSSKTLTCSRRLRFH